MVSCWKKNPLQRWCSLFNSPELSPPFKLFVPDLHKLIKSCFYKKIYRTIAILCKNKVRAKVEERLRLQNFSCFSKKGWRPIINHVHDIFIQHKEPTHTLFTFPFRNNRNGVFFQGTANIQQIWIIFSANYLYIDRQ